MPYQPTNPYPYNTGIDLREGLSFQFKVDNYDTIIKFEIEIYDLFRNERIYTIIREIGDIKIINDEKKLIEGDKQIIQILDDTNTLIYFDYYEGESVLPVRGGLAEESICRLELTNYLKTIEQIENERYYSNVEDFTDFQITEVNDTNLPNESYYIIDENDYITGINGSYIDTLKGLSKIVVPYQSQGKYIKGIGNNVFENFSNLQEIIIPSSIYEIGDNTFKNCTNLNSISLNYGISKIGNSAFEGCLNLIGIELLDSIVSIGEYCFKDCVNLTELKFSNSIKTISIGCFINNYSLVNLNLKKVEIIEANAFENCNSLSNIIFPENLKKIESYAFANCMSLYEVNLTNNLETIEEYAFSNCQYITKMIIPFVGENKNAEGKKGLFGYIFGECEDGRIQKASETEEYYFDIPVNIEQIEITNEETIPYGAFYNCTELTTLLLNEGLIEIGNYSFYNCNNLKNIELPSTVTTIGEAAFGLDNTVMFYEIENEDFFINLSKPKTLSIGVEAFINRTDIKDFEITDNVINVSKGAFKGCNSIETFTVPFIGENAKTTTNNYFTYIFGEDKITDETGIVISNLPKKVVLTKTIKNVPEWAFAYCGIENVILPNNLISVGEYAFYETSITSLNIPKTVTEINNYSFYNSVLKNINWNTLISTKDIFTIGENCFNLDITPEVNGYKFINVEGTSKIDFDEQSSSYSFDYSKGEVNTNPTTTIQGYFSLPYYLFCKLKENSRYDNYFQNNGVCGEELQWYLTLDVDNQYILNITGSGDMNNYSNDNRPPWETDEIMSKGIKEVIIGDECTSIGDYAFEDYKDLKNIKFPNNLTKIGERAFYHSGLNGELVFNTNLKVINESAFANCFSLTSVAFNNMLTTIKKNSFFGCENIKELNIPNSVTSIAEGAFCYMIGLQKITLPFVGTSKTAKGREGLFGHIFGDLLLGIGLYDDDRCYKITQIYETGNPQYSYLEPIETSKYTIPISLKEIYINGGAIASGAFSGLTHIEKVIISDEITSLGANIFWGTEDLKEIQVPYMKITTPYSNCYGYYYAYWDTHDLYWQKLASKPNNYLASLFGCRDKSANSAYEERTFYTGKGIEFELRSPIKKSNNYTYGNTELFIQIPLLQNITITQANLSEIGTFIYWSNNNFSFNLNLPNNIETIIPSRMFDTCNTIVDLNISVLPTSWEDACLYNSSIETINTLPLNTAFNETLFIGEKVFKWSNLKGSVVLPKIRYIAGDYYCDNNGAFDGVDGITEIEIKSGNKITIGEYAFYNCSNLRSVILRENSVSAIAEGAFSLCPISNLVLEEGLTSINYEAFDSIQVKQLILPNSLTFIRSEWSDNGDRVYGVFGGLKYLEEIVIPFVGRSRDNNKNKYGEAAETLLWWFGGKINYDDEKYPEEERINGYFLNYDTNIDKYIDGGKLPNLKKIVVTGDISSKLKNDYGIFYDWKRVAPNLKIYFTNVINSASIDQVNFNIYPDNITVDKYWYFKGEFDEAEILPATTSTMSLRSGATSYLNTIESNIEDSSIANANLKQRVMKLLSNKDYAWKALLYGKNFDVYITDNNTYADGSSYLPTLYLPNNSRMKEEQQITLIGEDTYKISNLETFSYTNKIFYRQSKGILNGKLNYFNVTTGLIQYDDIAKQWVIEDENFKASLTKEPVNFTIGSTYNSNNIDGTIAIDEEGNIIVASNSGEGTTLIQADTITIEKTLVTKGTIDADLVGVVKEGTKFYTNTNSRIQKVEDEPVNYYNIVFEPGFYVSSNGYNNVTITLADEALILPDDLLNNSIVLSIDTKGIITLEGNTGENIKRGIISENLIGIIKKGETKFTLNKVIYTIKDVNRNNNQITFEDENGNGFIVQELGKFDYDIILEDYIDIAKKEENDKFNMTDLHLTLNHINIYTVSDIEYYTDLSKDLLKEGEILYLIKTNEVINPTNFEVAERSLEKDFTLERYSTIVEVKGLNDEELQHILVYPDTFYEINSNYIETPQYYFQTSNKQNVNFYVNDIQLSKNDGTTMFPVTLESCSAKISSEYQGNLVWYKWEIQELIDDNYYTIKEFTEYYNPNIILNYDFFRNNMQYRLVLSIKTKEELEVKTYLYITVNFGKDLLGNFTIDKDCNNKAIKISFPLYTGGKNLFDFEEFVNNGGYAGIQYVNAENSSIKLYEYIGDEEYLYYNANIFYDNDFAFSYKTTTLGSIAVRFYNENQENITATINNLIEDGTYSIEQQAIIKKGNNVIIPYKENIGIKYFQVGFKVEPDSYFSEIQLEGGTEVTEYEEYCSETTLRNLISRYIVLREEVDNEDSLCKIAEIDVNTEYFYDYSFSREENYQYYIVPIYNDKITGKETRGVPHKLNSQINYNLKEVVLLDTQIELSSTNNFELLNSYEANTDEYSMWKFKFNTDAKNINVVTDKAVYETSMKIPVVNKTNKNYKTGTIKAFLGGFIKEKDRLTYRDSIKLQNKFQEFCDNGRVKMLRDEIGNVLPVDVTLTSFEYNPHTIPTNISVTFEWTQVGEEKDLSVWSKE